MFIRLIDTEERVVPTLVAIPPKLPEAFSIWDFSNDYTRVGPNDPCIVFRHFRYRRPVDDTAYYKEYTPWQRSS
jgi:hypothetical protein